MAYARGMSKQEYHRWYYQSRKDGILPELRDAYAKARGSATLVRRAAKRNGVAHDNIPTPGLHCEVCGQRAGGREFHLDHDHATGKFRGWLCHSCNVALGCVRDNPAILRKLASYLENRQ